MNKYIKVTILALATLGVISSCKKKFDEPPLFVAPNITANTTIAALKAMHKVSGNFDQVVDTTKTVIISGIVVANDKSGNIYKAIYLQDSTGGIELTLDATYLYTKYPVGRQVFVKCNGLYLSDYHGFPSLGSIDRSSGTTAASGITQPLIGKYLIGGSYNNPVVPIVVTDPTTLTGDMQDKRLGALIQLNNFEFGKGDFNKVYADTSSYKNSLNINVKDCSGNTLIVRSSGYADFAGDHVAQGNGKLLAIYSIYKSSATSTSFDKQLIIRDTSDVQFYGLRCFLFEEDFGAYPVSTSVPFAGGATGGGWQNLSFPAEDATKYYITSFSGVNNAKVSAFNSTQVATTNVTSWLISPAISLTGTTTPTLSFTTAARYSLGTFKVLVSTDYNGTTPATATWTQLPATMPTLPSTAFTPFIPSGSLSLSAFAGKTIYIAFRYDVPAGSAKSNIATFEVESIKLKP